MSGPSYPAAARLAARIEELIASSAVAYKQPGDATRPDPIVIEELISAAFWASMLREEGRNPQISLAYLAPEQSQDPLTFDSWLPLEPALLAHLAPAVQRPAIHLGVWWRDDRLHVWGTTHTLPLWCLVLEVISPGLLVVKYRRSTPTMKFANIAVLEGSTVKFIEQQDAVLTADLPALSSLFAFYTSAGRRESDTILVRIATSMRAHGHGGSLLVVPSAGDWLESIAQPFTYAVHPPYSGLAALLGECDLDGAQAPHEELRTSVEALAGLTAVDGATVIDDRFNLLAFGVKIRARSGTNHVERVLLAEPVEGYQDAELDATQLGGTRHLSAAQFVHDQHDAIAMVASQDGRFTVFAWSEAQQLVHAHRLETLLM